MAFFAGEPLGKISDKPHIVFAEEIFFKKFQKWFGKKIEAAISVSKMAYEFSGMLSSAPFAWTVAALCFVCALVAVLFLIFKIRELASVRISDCIRAETIGRLNSDLDKTSARLAISEDSNSQLKAKLAAAQERENALKERLELQALEAEKMRGKMAADFENLSNRIFSAAGTKLSASNREQMDLVLGPLKENLRNFELKVDELNRTQEAKNAGLAEHINMLGQMSLKIGKDAENLAAALTGRNKTAGNWGELVLSEILEACGLTEGREFSVQETSDSESGRLIPDVIVNLPDSRRIIIDSKVSLVNYERYCSSDSPELAVRRETALKAFMRSAKERIDELSAKDYSSQCVDGVSPDFVMLFMPIESAFRLMVQTEPNICLYAFKKKIVIVSPTTLLAALKTVESLWRVDRQSKNSREIARLGGVLYDKIKVFCDKFMRLGKGIKDLDVQYAEAMKTLSSGRGNVIRAAENLRELGSPVKSPINDALVEDAMEEASHDGSESGGAFFDKDK